MIFSVGLLKNSIEKYQKKRQENYSKKEALNSGFKAGFIYFMLLLSIIFFAIEIILFFFAINIAINCTKGGYERIVHIVLAVTFTLPYMLIVVFFSDCGKNLLRTT
jgi:hypothetical protein